MVERYCREGGIFHEKGKNEIFEFEKLENLKIRKEVTRCQKKYTVFVGQISVKGK